MRLGRRISTFDLQVKILSHTVIFAGAGASFAVNQKKLPMTKQFFESLPTPITDNRLFGYVSSFLREQLKSESIDIEQVLWAMRNVSDALKPFEKTSAQTNLLGALIHRGWAGEVVPRSNFQEIDLKLNALADITRDLERRINGQVFSHYSYRPLEEELANNWGQVMRALIERSGTFDIFTTNYDAVIESAAHYFGLDLDRGITNDVWAHLDQNKWSDSQSVKLPLLTKLHGSIDWVWGRDANGLRVVRPNRPEYFDDYEQRAIIYPGFKGVPETEPFISFHQYLTTSLGRASKVIFIGFAFRDDYLNKVFKDNISESAKKVIVDPVPPKSFPFSGTESRDVVLLTGKGFGAPEVMNALRPHLVV